jgi:hypothetical protein
VNGLTNTSENQDNRTDLGPVRRRSIGNVGQ